MWVWIFWTGNWWDRKRMRETKTKIKVLLNPVLRIWKLLHISNWIYINIVLFRLFIFKLIILNAYMQSTLKNIIWHVYISLMQLNKNFIIKLTGNISIGGMAIYRYLVDLKSDLWDCAMETVQSVEWNVQYQNTASAA